MDLNEVWGVGFRFVIEAHTSIYDCVFSALMEKVRPAIQKAYEHVIEIWNIGLGTHKIDMNNQLNVFFQDNEDKVARTKDVDNIRNRFGPKIITKTNT